VPPPSPRDPLPIGDLDLTRPGEWPTRLRILHEGSRLFAAKGYHGTSTRDIASAVGIRQPSLFHHFRSKQAIAEALLELDLVPSVADATHLASAAGSPAVRLFRYVQDDVLRGVRSPFDLRGLYFSDLLTEPEFARWGRMVDELHAAVRELVRQGIDAGDFVDVDPEFAVVAVNALVLEALRSSAGSNRRAASTASGAPGQAARFVLRALLRDQDRLPGVQAEAGTARSFTT
jgi:AcrR family transcriptional regulator